MASDIRRTFNQGLVDPDSVGRFLSDETVPASVEKAWNVVFGEKQGAIAVREGSSQVGGDVSGATDVLGIHAIRTATNNIDVAIFKDSGGAADAYYLNGSTWTAATGWVNKTANNHNFAQLNGSIFVANGADAMMSSSNGSAWSTTNCPTGITPLFVVAYRGQLLVATRTRVYFSSVVDPSSSPFITWDTANDWFDVNPDDGGYITGFARVGNVLVVMKNNGMYRVDIVSEAVTPDDIYDVGAISQSGMTVCQGVLYFYSGEAIYITEGSSFPQRISRAIEPILAQVSNTQDVYMTRDEFNVYVDVGDITYKGDSYPNSVFVWSTQDSTWTWWGHPYRMKNGYFNDKERKLYGGDTNAIYQFVDGTGNDDGQDIAYDVTLRVLDGQVPATIKKLSQKFFIYTRDAVGSAIVIQNRKGQKGTIAVGKDITVERPDGIEPSEEFHITWQGTRSGKQPVFDGVDMLYDESVSRQ